MIRCLGNNVLLFPLPEILKSPGGIEYPDTYRMDDRANQRFWVAAKGPKVTELNIYDHVLCPMPVEDHPRLEGGARVVNADQVIAKFEHDGEIQIGTGRSPDQQSGPLPGETPGPVSNL